MAPVARPAFVFVIVTRSRRFFPPAARVPFQIPSSFRAASWFAARSAAERSSPEPPEPRVRFSGKVCGPCDHSPAIEFPAAVHGSLVRSVDRGHVDRQRPVADGDSSHGNRVRRLVRAVHGRRQSARGVRRDLEHDPELDRPGIERAVPVACELPGRFVSREQTRTTATAPPRAGMGCFSWLDFVNRQGNCAGILPADSAPVHRAVDRDPAGVVPGGRQQRHQVSPAKSATCRG